MKLNHFILSVVIMFSGSLSAQNFIGKINPYPQKSVETLVGDTLNILAVMVNFQEDKDGATFGNGKFGSIYSDDYGQEILDPLPHNKNYFEQHLTFVKNYFNKVSKRKLEIKFNILSDTFSVSKTMRNYSPTPGSDDYTPVGEFAKEVWIKTSQLNPSINYSEYDVFLIFHAGVGRDISLPGSIGNERDLPSLYLSNKAIKEIFNNDLSGFPINKFGSTNSLIIPETESRELETITGNFLFEITINGLLVASIASHLGLPDLYNTETGLSAIGRFGLMDGQSIFAYNGCFPPEPSAWEKVLLGWADPIVIAQENTSINLAANLVAELSDTVILKVPINSSEYYLIENRQRDVKDKGANLSYVVNGNSFIKRFDDTTGFYSYDTDSLSGVVVDIDEFDWALPGNGIVIWHIDESVVNEKLESNTINNDKDRRGVDVEEADGVQDIGEKYITILGDEVIGEGTEEDFWFRGNSTKLYKNIFSKNSRPNTNTNSGANSLITIKDFSVNSSKMNFKIEFGDSIIKPLFSSNGYIFNGANNLTALNTEKYQIAVNSDSILYISDGDSIVTTFLSFSEFKPISFSFGGKTYLIGLNAGSSAQQFPTTINFWTNELSSSVFSSVLLPYLITAPPVAIKNANELYDIYLGTNDGKVLVFDFGSLISSNVTPKEIIQISDGVEIKQISIFNSGLYAIGNKTGSGILYFNGDVINFSDEQLLKLATSSNSDAQPICYVSSTNSNSHFIYVINDEGIISKINVNSLTSANSFSLADLKNDGNNNILVNSGNRVYAFNSSGSIAQNFPYELKDNDEFIGLPLAADIEGDSKSEIISVTKSGKVFALDGGTGKLVDGFPISFGSGLKTEPMLFSTGESVGLAGVDSNNTLSGWSVSSISGKIDWAEVFRNNLNNSSLEAAALINVINEFFPTNRAYNYPNPVYDGQTAIRYFVNEDSKINIKIFDIAGGFVAEFNSQAQGGLDNEIYWNVEDIQSGVYLARIEATSNSGKSESTVIKIAVVK